jgi:hypothetical protein
LKPRETQKLGKYLEQLVYRNGKLSSPGRAETLKKLIDLYETVEAEDTTEARQVRQAFLFIVANGPHPSEPEPFINFFIQSVKPDDLQEIQWGTPERYFRLTQFLYALRGELPAEEVAQYVNNLMHYALRSFEQEQKYPEMIELLQLINVSPGTESEELLQLRSHAYIHEIHRVRRFRRFLYGYLLLQALFILVIFPLLFINAENGAISKAIEQATDVELQEESHQYLTYGDGLYWALITASSIGYGDVTPVTTVGRVIAATLGAMGVITVGILAGLILYQMTPRNF